MNHDEAVREHWAEGYLLGDLPKEVRDAFEEHYFDCQSCANDVRTGFAFAGALRAQRQDPFLARQIARMKRRFIGSFAAAAAALIGLFAMQFGRVLPLQTQLAEARRPTTPAAHVFSESRGEGAAIISRGALSELIVQIEPDAAAPQYTWSILDGRGQTHDSMSVSTDPATQLTLSVLIPAQSLQPGQYKLRVVGRRTVEYSFAVQ